jgi:hypothetical protein
MVAVTWKLGDGAQKISLNIECQNLKNNRSIVTSDLRKQSKLLGEEDLLELRFHLDELQLFTKSTRPHVRNLLLSLSK